MKEHSITWYESVDGEIFTDKMECISHELNILYKNSGVRFYKNGVLISELNDNSYNEMTDIYINRGQARENDALCSFIHDNYGWCYVEDALEDFGTFYHFSESPFELIAIVR